MEWHQCRAAAGPRRAFQSRPTAALTLPVAVSDVAGSATLSVTRHAPLSTLNHDLIDSAISDYEVVDRIEAPTRRLSEIIDEYAAGRVIDFLKIDVEGHKHAVLRSADLSRHRPTVLVIEATSPATNAPTWLGWESIVLSARYQFALRRAQPLLH